MVSIQTLLAIATIRASTTPPETKLTHTSKIEKEKRDLANTDKNENILAHCNKLRPDYPLWHQAVLPFCHLLTRDNRRFIASSIVFLENADLATLKNVGDLLTLAQHAEEITKAIKYLEPSLLNQSNLDSLFKYVSPYPASFKIGSLFERLADLGILNQQNINIVMSHADPYQLISQDKFIYESVMAIGQKTNAQVRFDLIMTELTHKEQRSDILKEHSRRTAYEATTVEVAVAVASPRPPVNPFRRP